MQVQHVERIGARYPKGSPVNPEYRGIYTASNKSNEKLSKYYGAKHVPQGSLRVGETYWFALVEFMSAGRQVVAAEKVGN